jgi:L-alanine-DL-glutamate epimerase-like enolase superfamily enzyme
MTTLSTKPESGAASMLAIVGGTIIDGMGGSPLRDGVLLIEDRRIVTIGDASVEIPSHAHRISAAGQFVMPGMMDANVHLFFTITPDLLVRYEGLYEAVITEAAEIALRNGITTLFDTWGPRDALTRVRDSINRGERLGSRIFFAGNIIGFGGPTTRDFFPVARTVFSRSRADEIDARWEQGVGPDLLYMTPEQVRARVRTYLGIEKCIDREILRRLWPPGGARNAVDCALWDLEAKLTGRPVWELAGVGTPRPLVTFLTCGAADPERMAAAARGYHNAPAIKLKLTGEPIDADRVRAVRQARPEVTLTVDANQGFTQDSLEQLMPTLIEARVMLIEQPFPVGQEALLDGFSSPIPIAADESVQGVADIDRLAGRCGIVNIKLDKCGGLTEGLAMARVARSHGLRTWVGNMIGTSLAMAPAFVLGQVCDFVELDGPIFLEADRATPVTYSNGIISCREELWGGAR